MEQEINKIILAMKKVLISNFFKEDNEGNMIREHTESRTTVQYRFSFQDRQVKLDQRENRSHWVKMGTEPYTKIKILKDGFIFNGNKISTRTDIA